MKILKPGKPKAKKMLIGQCRECGCKFEMFPSEGRYEQPGPRPDDGDFYRAKCPTCKNEVIVYP
jgi:hypothetical protein